MDGYRGGVVEEPVREEGVEVTMRGCYRQALRVWKGHISRMTARGMSNPLHRCIEGVIRTSSHMGREHIMASEELVNDGLC